MHKSLARAILRVCRSYGKGVFDAYEDFQLPNTNSSDITDFIKSTIETFESDINGGDFEKAVKYLVESFVRKVDQGSKSSFKASISSINNTFTIENNMTSPAMQEVLKATIEANVQLIKKVALEDLENIASDVFRSIQGGLGLKELTKKIKQRGIQNKLRALRIAEDQTRKAYNAINLQNMKSNGITKFEWLHSGGSAYPRSYHKNHYKNGGLNHGIFSISEPPIIDKNTGERGFPAQLPNCKCVMIPVIEVGNAD
jgi:SPP1 gp7 family putative phage head morphogenesis protein